MKPIDPIITQPMFPLIATNQTYLIFKIEVDEIKSKLFRDHHTSFLINKTKLLGQQMI